MALAKPVLKNKFWIVEENGEKVAAVLSTAQGVVLVDNNRRERFNSTKLLSNKYNINFVDTPSIKKNKEKSIYDFPCDSVPHNSIYDLKYRLPLYTKSNKSKSFYCAGYYLLELDGVWQTVFCPKRLVLTRNKFHGPYKDIKSAAEIADNLGIER
jgi:hypothetical protein